MKLNVINEQWFNVIISSIKKYHRKSKMSDSFASRQRKERRTLRLQLPRLMGNTFIAAKLLKICKDSIYITHRLRSCEFFREKFKIDRRRTFTTQMTDLPLRSDIVIVDNTSCLTQKQIDRVYDIDAKFFVLLG